MISLLSFSMTEKSIRFIPLPQLDLVYQNLSCAGQRAEQLET
jgi:hypothetical protein